MSHTLKSGEKWKWRSGMQNREKEKYLLDHPTQFQIFTTTHFLTPGSASVPSARVYKWAAVPKLSGTRNSKDSSKFSMEKLLIHKPSFGNAVFLSCISHRIRTSEHSLNFHLCSFQGGGYVQPPPGESTHLSWKAKRRLNPLHVSLCKGLYISLLPLILKTWVTFLWAGITTAHPFYAEKSWNLPQASSPWGSKAVPHTVSAVSTPHCLT